MILVENSLVHEDLIKEEFVCNLNRCKGACCVMGNVGAPLEAEELKILEEIYPKVKPYLTEKGIAAIEKDGVYVKDFEDDYTTTCVDGDKECAYTIFENGIAFCGIEKAHREGVIDFKKPISCHLYPIRITKYPEFEVLNYDRWHICAAACEFGKALKVPVYQFLKDPLIRKYGEQWFAELEEQISAL
ncbi:DUF3109 family protein [Solitalea canadensis]|uniref:DUF3109 family protein n=1 Tax=Solitalea canadensis (strain ATCC 29591 / DSM 3403 / JCM 21819 / LMG 8368 / NBRC 15130 / NCIMB 12057 / USAM 9D) TaxID=929556 RepID=H8KMA7_SOLCM|nr:DUF3109 family protein [Solitalea canadensis]AFD09289.1 Protein of unknown function (DUF3109) [Solitalea canadensis DSM 3403]